jgi:GT2 family glycosyltransferase/aryl carrier-like protein
MNIEQLQDHFQQQIDALRQDIQNLREGNHRRQVGQPSAALGNGVESVAQLAQRSTDGSLLAQLTVQQLELERSQTQLHSKQLELEKLQTQLKETQQEQLQAEDDLAEAQTGLAAVEADLLEAQAKLKERNTKIQQLRVKIQDQQNLMGQLLDRITAMESSKFWQLRTRWVQFKRLLGAQEQTTWTPPEIVISTATANPSQQEQKQQLPQTTTQLKKQQPQNRQSQTKKQRYGRKETAYDLWLQLNTPSQADLNRMTVFSQALAHKPLISVIMPVYNPPKAFLVDAIASVLAQAYPYWELCIADDASTEPHVKEVLEEYAALDSRIKVLFRPENGHISRATNSALELATGDYIALLDHDDLLTPHALYEVVMLLIQHPEADMIYSDEDKIDENNKLRDPFFKPDWCPDTFLSRMYTCHLGVYRRTLVHQIGGFRVGFEGSQDYDLVLRLTEQTDKIFHIPTVLYHWRVHAESVTSSAEAKPYAYTAAIKALSEALLRRGEPGEVQEISDYPGHYLVRYQITTSKRVSIIIPTRDLGHLLNQCLESIFTKSTYPDYEVILIDNGSTEPYTAKVINEWLNREPDRFRCYFYGIPFNYPKLNNFGVSKATGEYLLFLNNDTEVITHDWIEAMVEQAQRPTIGAVGPLLLYADDTVQHAGVVLGIGRFAGHSHRHFSATSPGYVGQLITINNYSAVTGACLMVRREIYEAVGGLEEELAVACNDIDLCLKILRQGYRNIYLPHVQLYHYESKSRGYETTPAKRARYLQEAEFVLKRWTNCFEHDPCYNPNLTLSREDYSIREPYDSPFVHDMSHQLGQARNQMKQMESKLEEVQSELETAHAKVVTMETSKFWQLRQRWFQVKRSLGLPTEE